MTAQGLADTLGKSKRQIERILSNLKADGRLERVGAAKSGRWVGWVVKGYGAMNKDIFSFVIYMIHACANHWKQNPSEVYKNMKSTNCIMGFLVPNYEILHTQSTKYIVEDIKEYFNVRGISI